MIIRSNLFSNLKSNTGADVDDKIQNERLYEIQQIVLKITVVHTSNEDWFFSAKIEKFNKFRKNQSNSIVLDQRIDDKNYRPMCHIIKYEI